MFSKREQGFTSLELVIAIAVTTLTAVVFFLMVSDTNKISQLTKESHYAEELISNYVQYYEDTYIDGDNVHSFFEDTGRVNLVNNVKRYITDEADFPKHFDNLEVICDNTPKLSEDGTFIQFTIKCKVNERPVNKDYPYVVKRFIK